MVDHAANTLALRQLKQSEQVSPVAVNAPRPQQAEQVQRGAPGNYMITRTNQCRVVEERPILDSGVEPRQLLVNNKPCPHVLMPNLRVAHLPIRQANRVL
jgi:hypothetical protein